MVAGFDGGECCKCLWISRGIPCSVPATHLCSIHFETTWADEQHNRVSSDNFSGYGVARHVCCSSLIRFYSSNAFQYGFWKEFVTLQQVSSIDSTDSTWNTGLSAQNFATSTSCLSRTLTYCRASLTSGHILSFLLFGSPLVLCRAQGCCEGSVVVNHSFGTSPPLSHSVMRKYDVSEEKCQFDCLLIPRGAEWLNPSLGKLGIPSLYTLYHLLSNNAHEQCLQSHCHELQKSPKTCTCTCTRKGMAAFYIFRREESNNLQGEKLKTFDDD